jgi:hypothetical protein
MRARTDTTPNSNSLGIPEKRPSAEPLEYTCPVCTGQVGSQETVIFWRARDGHYVVLHPDCARAAAARKRVL